MRQTTTDKTDIERGDVIRGRAYGNKNRANYVVDGFPSHRSDYLPTGAISVLAHNEYSGQPGRYMIIQDPKVIRTYK
jgi:hypothetical protein